MRIGGDKGPMLKDVEDADVMEQGYTYEEEEVIIDGEEDEEDGGNKRRSLSTGDKTKSMLIAGAVIVVIIVIAIALFSAKKASDKAAEERAAQLLEEEEAFYYSPAEIEALRNNGYTGTEIEGFEELGIPAQLKIDEATLAREKLYKEEIAPVLDGASDAYRELEAKTWVGGEPFELTKYKEDEWSSRFKEMNCNYEKVEPHGYQLWVIISPHNIPDMKLFVSVSPEVYDKMYDAGNVVVNLEYKYNSDLNLTIITGIKNLKLSDN